MERILVVDPDEHSRLIMEVGLKSAGLEVLCVDSSQGAWYELSVESYDLILTEAVIEGEEDFSFAQALKDNEATAEIPLIFITGRKRVEDKIGGLEIGAEDYFTKPIYLREFVARVRGYLKKNEVTRLGAGKLRDQYKGELAPNLVHDIMRSMMETKKNGSITLSREGREGRLYFKDGSILDAECGSREGRRAATLLLLWEKGEFEISFDESGRSDRIGEKTENVFLSGLKARRVFSDIRKKESRLQSISLMDILCAAEAESSIAFERLWDLLGLDDEGSKDSRSVNDDEMAFLLDLVENLPDTLTGQAADGLGRRESDAALAAQLPGSEVPIIEPEVHQSSVLAVEEVKEKEEEKEEEKEAKRPEEPPGQGGDRSSASIRLVTGEMKKVKKARSSKVYSARRSDAVDNFDALWEDIEEEDDKFPAKGVVALVTVIAIALAAAAYLFIAGSETEVETVIPEGLPAQSEALEQEEGQAPGAETGTVKTGVFEAAGTPALPQDDPGIEAKKQTVAAESQTEKIVEPPDRAESAVREKVPPHPSKPSSKKKNLARKKKSGSKAVTGKAYSDYLKRGNQNLKSHKLAQAEKHFQQALSLSPGGAGAHLGLGRVYMERGKPAPASLEFEKASKLAPRMAEAWLRLGEARVFMGETAKAKVAYQKYLKLKPTGKTAREIRKLLKNM